jgi:23S rRNA (cytidine1920-2'-O)/16S rRNA (cytidine1409-2'-O)-methyltransferase
VVAVDVGFGQLDPRLRSDPRVTVLERTNIRALSLSTLGPSEAAHLPADVVTADLSFISLRVVAPVLTGEVLAPAGSLVALVKPQFEAGRAEVSRGSGVIRDPDTWRRAIAQVASALQDAGTGIMGAMKSPVVGRSGNVEFFVHAVKGADPTRPERIQEFADAVLHEHPSGEGR